MFHFSVDLFSLKHENIRSALSIFCQKYRKWANLTQKLTETLEIPVTMLHVTYVLY